MSCAPLA